MSRSRLAAGTDGIKFKQPRKRRKVSEMKMKVWTEAYRPFMLGDVHAPICTDIEVGEPVDLGGGNVGYLVASPTGKTYVAEGTTGALVGSSIAQVREDISAADPAVLRKQLAWAAERVKAATLLEKDEFWGMFAARAAEDKS